MLQRNIRKAYRSSMLPAIVVCYKHDSSTLSAFISSKLPAIVVPYKCDCSALLVKNYSLKNQEGFPQMCPS
jgi:hypothetical protein